jgi:hypothetical protein
VIGSVEAFGHAGNNLSQGLQSCISLIQEHRQTIFHHRKWRGRPRNVGPIRLEPKFHGRGRILGLIEQYVRDTRERVSHELGTKFGEDPSNVGKRPEPFDVQADSVKAIKEYLEVDFDDGAVWVHKYVCDLAHWHAPKPNGARDVKTEDILGGVGDHPDCGTVLQSLNEENRRSQYTNKVTSMKAPSDA